MNDNKNIFKFTLKSVNLPSSASASERLSEYLFSSSLKSSGNVEVVVECEVIIAIQATVVVWANLTQICSSVRWQQSLI